MDYFKLGKYQSITDNPVYLAKTFYQCLTRPMAVDVLFSSVLKKLNLINTPDIEQAMLLALCFSHGIGLITYDENLLSRRKQK